jgi:ssDNA-binding Zn-finger/Zn-ribbon topoisomerase 1
MCFYTDDYPEFHETTTPKARKPHRCEECGRTIQRGEQYHRASGKFDGVFYSTATCLECEATRKIIHEAEIAEGCHWSDSWCPVGELREAIRERGYGIIEVDADYEPVKLLRPEAAHLFPELARSDA